MFFSIFWGFNYLINYCHMQKLFFFSVHNPKNCQNLLINIYYHHILQNPLNYHEKRWVFITNSNFVLKIVYIKKPFKMKKKINRVFLQSSRNR